MKSIVKLGLIALLSVFLLTIFVFSKTYKTFAQTTGTTYYVATTGSDTNIGTLSAPFRTINKGASVLKPGDTLYVRGGVYKESVYVSVSGTTAAPVKIMAYQGEIPVVDGNNFTLPVSTWAALFRVAGNYVNLSGFEVRYSNWMGVTVSGQNNIISNFNSHHNMENGILLTGSHNIVEYSRVWQNDYSNVNCSNSRGNWASGLSAARNPTDSIIRHNVVYENWGEGMSTYEDNHTVLEDNVVYNNYSVNVYISDTSYALLQRNLIYNTPDNPTACGLSTGIAMSSEVGYANSNNTIINNFVLGTKINFQYWYSNLGANDGLINDIIANNTFVNSTKEVNVKIDSSPYHSNTVFANNIILQEDSLAISNLVSSPGITYSNNNWSKTPSSGAGAGDVIANPGLAKIGTYSAGQLSGEYFKIQSTSPVVNKAKVLSSVTEDYFKGDRGTIPDIGGHEYGAAVNPISSPSACPDITLQTNLGVIDSSVNITSTGSYRVWSRIMASSDSSNSYYLQIDNSCPINVGDLNGMTANNWQWVDYRDGSINSKIDLTLSAGSHIVKLIGKETGTKLDEIIFTQDFTCVPTGLGTNCLTTPIATPTINPTPTVSSTVIPTSTPVASGNVTVSLPVTSSSDDAEEDSTTGSLYTNSSDLELTNDPGNWTTPGQQVVGMRFNSVNIPKGAIINNAYVELVTKETQWTETTNLTIQGEAVDNSSTFSTVSKNISSRVKTSSSALWSNVPVWNTSGAKVQTPNINKVIQEIVNRSGWNSGNSLSLILTGTGHRTAYTYDGSSSYAPKIVISYSTGSTSVPLPTPTPTPTPLVDVTPPTSPANLVSTNVTHNSISLSWGASTDNVGVSKYWVVRNNVTVGSTTSTTFTDATVSASTSYNYYVIASDVAGNNSNPSNIVSVTTTSSPDTTLPSAPANLIATVISSTQINLSWGVSTDNVAVVGYQVYRNSNLVATVSGLSYGDGSLNLNTSYNYFVKAVDAAGNISLSSNTVTATTQQPPQLTPGNIQGTVYTSLGRVLTGAKVIIIINGSKKTYYTNSTGAYSILNLNPLTYSLTYSNNRYVTQKTSVTVSSGQTSLKDVTLVNR